MAALLKRWVVDTGAAPGACACVGVFHASEWRVVAASAGSLGSPNRPTLDCDAIYDLASLTKPIVACLVARLVREGRLAWERPLSALLPELSGTAAAASSLELLASHRAGLEAHLVLGDVREPEAFDREGALRRCAEALRPECHAPPPPEGYPPVYSDLGYVLMGAALERLFAQPLAELIRAEVAVPLGLHCGSAAQLEGDRADFLLRVAPTETLVSRGGTIAGQVHDDNAWLLSGRHVSGHAGLFGTALDVARFGMAVLDAWRGRRPDWLGLGDVQPLIQERPGGSLRMGFDGKSAKGSSAGERFGSGSFGHLGFTGTSLWCEPEQGVVVALLSNRVHPTRENILIRSVRPQLHGALLDLGRQLRD